MDIRIARTDRAIEQAFMELREKNPLEKIKIKDLCAMACINKSTFYAHYEDIYALANALENKLIESILASVPRTNDSVALHQAETLTPGAVPCLHAEPAGREHPLFGQSAGHLRQQHREGAAPAL